MSRRHAQAITNTEGFYPAPSVTIKRYIGAGSTKVGMVEARGVEPLSEDRQHTASTCVADNLDSRPSTPIGRLRTAASPEQSRPQPLSTSLGPARCIAPFHPRGPQVEERHSLIKLRVPVLDWQLHFPGVNESPRARHATVVSVSPSKPVAPFLQDVENAL
jgi:hypothetical protein